MGSSPDPNSGEYKNSSDGESSSSRPVELLWTSLLMGHLCVRVESRQDEELTPNGSFWYCSLLLRPSRNVRSMQCRATLVRFFWQQAELV